MNRLPFTKYASKALNEGREIAGYLGFKDVSSIFVLLGLYGADGSLASEVLKMHGVTRELIEEAIKEKSKMPKDRRRTVMDTPKTEYLLEIAGELAMKYGCEAIGSEHILMAMIKDGDNEAFRFLEDHKISSEGIYTDILVTAGIDFRSAKNEYNEAISDGGDMEDGAGEYMLLQYSTDLTEKAMLGKLDPMIGRESEMERLMQVLCRRTKNNPCLIGDPGVGKTAIVEGLAQRIADELGYELEVYKIEWSSILMGLQDGSYDAVMTGVYYSPERDETYDFSTPYYKRQIVGVVRADSEYANYTKLSQFAGKNTKLTTQIATNYVPYKDEVPGGVIATDYETSSECFLAVQNKTADMVILDYTTSISALSTMNNLKMLNLDFTEPEGASNDCCIVFREGDPMRDTVQEALDKLNWNDKAEFDKLMDEMVKLQPSSN